MSLIAGVDEVGRGCLFGSVVAAAVVVNPAQEAQLWAMGVRDSKKLFAKKRTLLVPKIEAVVADWAIAAASVEEIDEVNILQATFFAMGRAVEQLITTPDELLIDGKQIIPNCKYAQTALIKGDDLSGAIAAASILAKVYRDKLMVEFAETYPEYDLANNKGYGTKKHRLAIANYGLTPHHRRSFKLKEFSV
ncbi:MAG: ribonuclease HII [Limnothrix sp.]